MRRNGRARPRPNPAKITSARGTGRIRAAPMAAPMKGPVQGVAMKAASTPVQKEPAEPGFSARLLPARSEEHTSELQSLMRISYAAFCLKKKKNKRHKVRNNTT